MKLLNVLENGLPRAAVSTTKDTLEILEYESIDEILTKQVPLHSLRKIREVDTTSGIQFLPPIKAPQKIICTGINYIPHIEETGMEKPEHPTFFAKFASALAGPFDTLSVLHASHAMDWEAELVVVIGKPISNATQKEAEEAIVGFTIGNDVSARDLQIRTNQWLSGKSLPNSTPLGPYLVTSDEIGIAPDLQLEALVNNQQVQSARTSELLFSPVDLVIEASKLFSLQPGDLIFTGTPSGVGAFREPKWFLKPEDRLVTRIEKLGQCENVIS